MCTRQWRFGLTADEWLRLASAGQESEVGPCCGQISELREALQMLTTGQHEELMVDGAVDYTFDKITLEAYEAVLSSGDDHTLPDRSKFPLLHRVLDGIREAWRIHDAETAAWRARRAKVASDR